jgi:hypothetical protein
MPLQTPCRAVVTTLPAFTIQAVNLAGSTCSIPPPNNGVIAYAINVTVTPKEGYLGYLVIWPVDPKNPQTVPPTSTVNSPDGRVKTNAAIVAGGYGGEVNVLATNTTDLVLDLTGYFTTDAPYVYVPITPCRLVDTRMNNGTRYGAPYVTANQTRTFSLVNNPCNLPPQMLVDGGALSLNVTALPRNAAFADVTVWGTSPTELQPQPPPFPTLIVKTPFVAANAAIVTMDRSPSDSVSASATTDVDLLIDITGYFAPPKWAPTGLSLYLLSPCRVLDTRRPTSDGLALPTGFKGELNVPVNTENPCSVPRNAQAYVLNATVVPLPVLGYLTLWADGTPEPNVSTLNAPDGFVTSNMAIVASFNGSIDAFAATPEPDNNTQLILDVSGYFDPGP